MRDDYDDTQGYLGPGVFHVPRKFISKEENKEAYKHDYSNSYQKLGNHAYWMYNEGDKNWKVKGPWTAMGSLVWEYKKHMLPHTDSKRMRAVKRAKKEEDSNAMTVYNSVPPPLERPIYRARRGDRIQAWQLHNTNPQVYGTGMQGTKRKARTFKKKGGLRRRTTRSRYRGGKRRLRQFRRGGSLSGVYRKLKRINHRLSVVPALSKRRVHLQFSGGSTGSTNNWQYRVVDNMFSVHMGAENDPDVYGYGWNFFKPFYDAVLQVYGTAALLGNRYSFNNRVMKTVFVSPSNTPTWVEVFLLKPKRSGQIRKLNAEHPLSLADTGTTSSTGANPGGVDPYTVIGAGGTDTNNGVLGFANGLLGYNPFTDKQNMKDRWSIAKKWKFILGPNGSKVITVRSNKRFDYRPASYYNGTSTSQDLAFDRTSAFDYIKSSRPMIVRWHGAMVVADTASLTSYNGAILQGTSADVLLVKRWFEFDLFKQDTAVDIYGYSAPSESVLTTDTRTNYAAFGADALKASMFQPT